MTNKSLIALGVLGALIGISLGVTFSGYQQEEGHNKAEAAIAATTNEYSMVHTEEVETQKVEEYSEGAERLPTVPFVPTTNVDSNNNRMPAVIDRRDTDPANSNNTESTATNIDATGKAENCTVNRKGNCNNAKSRSNTHRHRLRDQTSGGGV